jgi:ferredoxin-type protein NapH
VLEITKMKKDEVSNLKLENGKFSIASGDCTLCGRCVDVCHQDALAYENRLKKLL